MLETANGETGVQLVGDVLCPGFLLKDCLYCDAATESLLSVNRFCADFGATLVQNAGTAAFYLQAGENHWHQTVELTVHLVKERGLYYLEDPFEWNSCGVLTCPADTIECFSCGAPGCRIKTCEGHGESVGPGQR